MSETNSPKRYNQYPLETIEIMERVWGIEKTKTWCEMTAFKYRMRMGHKDNIDLELKKEQWYLQRAKSYEAKKL